MIDGGLRRLLRDNLPRVHWQAIETGGVGAGVPDVNGCYEGREFWVELKRTRGGSYLLDTFRPEQVGWLLRRHRAGGRVHVLTRRQHDGGPRRGPPVDELWLHAGADARELKTHGLQASTPAGYWTGGPAGWDWDELLSLLTG